MRFIDIVRRFAEAVLRGLITILVPGRSPAEAPDGATAEQPDVEGLKAERVQFWEGLIDDGWRREADGKALYRTILCDDAQAASGLAATVDANLAPCGYCPDTVDVLGNVLSVRLTSATVGKLTEQDYAAALMIDTCV